jgi:hypothetical protein
MAYTDTRNTKMKSFYLSHESLERSEHWAWTNELLGTRLGTVPL